MAWVGLKPVNGNAVRCVRALAWLGMESTLWFLNRENTVQLDLFNLNNILFIPFDLFYFRNFGFVSFLFVLFFCNSASRLTDVLSYFEVEIVFHKYVLEKSNYSCGITTD